MFGVFRHFTSLPFAFCLFTFSLSRRRNQFSARHQFYSTATCGRFSNKAVSAVTARRNPKAIFGSTLRSEAIKGGENNTNDIVPGHSDRSQLLRYVAGLDKDIQMPPLDTGPPLRRRRSPP